MFDNGITSDMVVFALVVLLCGVVIAWAIVMLCRQRIPDHRSTICDVLWGMNLPCQHGILPDREGPHG